MQERISTGEFIVCESGRGASRVRTDYRRKRRRQETEERRMKAAGMWLKMSICAVALLIVIAVEVIALTGPKNEPVQAVSGEADAESGTGDAYGKLQFVYGGGARSVFSASRRWSAPVDALEVQANDGGDAVLKAAPGDRVSLPAAGEVREVFTDEDYGLSMRISHGEGLESAYFGFDTVRVEVGQPLLALDTLGTVGERGTMKVSVLQDGTRQDALQYIDAVKSS